MAGICFYYERPDIDVWSGKKLDAWTYACKAAGDIDSMIVINESDDEPERPCRSLMFHVVETLADALGIMNGELTTQVVTPWETSEIEPLDLWHYDHKTDWYLFGPARGWRLPVDVDAVITLPQSGGGALHAVHVASAVLLHRYWMAT